MYVSGEKKGGGVYLYITTDSSYRMTNCMSGGEKGGIYKTSFTKDLSLCW